MERAGMGQEGRFVIQSRLKAEFERALNQENSNEHKPAQICGELPGASCRPSSWQHLIRRYDQPKPAVPQNDTTGNERTSLRRTGGPDAHRAFSGWLVRSRLPVLR